MAEDDLAEVHWCETLFKHPKEVFIEEHGAVIGGIPLHMAQYDFLSISSSDLSSPVYPYVLLK